MTTAQIIIGIALIVFAVFLIIAVLMQQGKSHNLSGTIAGGAETFFGKSKAQTMNKKLSILTSTVAVVFVLLVGTVFVMQKGGDIKDYSFVNTLKTMLGGNEAVEETVDDEHEGHDHDEEEAEDTAAADDNKDETTAADDTTVADTTAAETTAA